MENFILKLKDTIFQNIREVERTECSLLQKSKLIIPQLEQNFEGLKSFIVNYSFKDEKEEISFFKDLKPKLFSRLIYYYNVYNIEMRMPAGSIDVKKRYLKRIQDQIKYFFDMNSDFYQYYRSGSIHLDHVYFLRGKPDIQLLLDSSYFDRDADFSTGYDFKAAKIIVNEMLATYIESKLTELEYSTNNPVSSLPFPKTKITWTGKKAELVEQIYAWIEAECFNNGKICIKELVEYIETVFNIDLGNYYHVFIEMRERVGSRTIFLDKLIKFLNKRMDDADKIKKNELSL